MKYILVRPVCCFARPTAALPLLARCRTRALPELGRVGRLRPHSPRWAALPRACAPPRWPLLAHCRYRARAPRPRHGPACPHHARRVPPWVGLAAPLAPRPTLGRALMPRSHARAAARCWATLGLRPRPLAGLSRTLWSASGIWFLNF